MEQRLADRMDRRLEETGRRHAAEQEASQKVFLADLQRLIGDQHTQQQQQLKVQQAWMSEQQQWIQEQRQRQEQHDDTQKRLEQAEADRQRKKQHQKKPRQAEAAQKHELTKQQKHPQHEGELKQAEQVRSQQEHAKGNRDENREQRVQQGQDGQKQQVHHEQQQKAPGRCLTGKREASRSAEGTPAKGKVRMMVRKQEEQSISSPESMVDWAADGSDSGEESIAPPPSTPSSCRARWAIGDRVSAEHVDGKWYEARITAREEDGAWIVTFVDGVMQGNCLPKHLRDLE
ncbi:hypothetical protein DIPPA_09528 [Diplonema papillatum]|nr:hypothetical protein DIPPA_09528 [Diplonema papillatum]